MEATSSTGHKQSGTIDVAAVHLAADSIDYERADGSLIDWDVHLATKWATQSSIYMAAVAGRPEADR